MESQRIRRRRLLQLGGATLAATAAGCLGSDSGNGNGNGNGDNTDETPAYAEWVTAVDGEISVSYVDLVALNENEDEDDDSSDDSMDIEDIEDPMFAVPFSGALSAMLGASFGLSGARLSAVIDFEQTGETEFSTSIDEILMANEAIVLIGDVDTDEIDNTVTAATESDFGAEVQFEQTSTVSGYTIYEPAGDGQQETTLGVSGDAIIHGEGTAAVEQVIETKQGDGTRAVDEFETFKRLLSTGGNGDMTFGGYSPDGFDENEDQSAGQFEELEGANGVVGSLTLSESSGSAEMGIDFDDVDDAMRDELKSVLGSLAADVSIDIDGGFVSASATYSEDAFENASTDD